MCTAAAASKVLHSLPLSLHTKFSHSLTCCYLLTLFPDNLTTQKITLITFQQLINHGFLPSNGIETRKIPRLLLIKASKCFCGYFSVHLACIKDLLYPNSKGIKAGESNNFYSEKVPRYVSKNGCSRGKEEWGY